jgi:hypothetical protein
MPCLSYENKINKPKHCLSKCIFCDKIEEKRYMKCLMLRDNGWATPKAIGFICPECLPNLYEQLEIKE